MTVAEMIEELRKMPGHARVLIEQAGWEDDDVRLEADATFVTWEGNHVLVGSDAA